MLQKNKYIPSLNTLPNKWLWAGFIGLSLPALILALSLIFKVFPIANVDLTSNRNDTLEVSQSLSATYEWNTLYTESDTPIHQALSFSNDSRLKNYIELQDNGHATFQSIINDGVYSPYFWSVRHFQEGQKLEHHLRINPQGNPFGFSISLPETYSLPNTSVDDARTIAEKMATEDWGVDLLQYSLIETSSKEQPNGRLDHSFTYEHLNYHFNDAKLRVNLSFSGNLFTNLTHYFYIPQTFFQEFEHMRSFNNTLAQVALFFMICIYFFGIGSVSSLHFIKEHFFIIRPALLWAMFLAGLTLLTSLNELPLTWMSYDTAISRPQFVTTILISNLSSFFITTIFYCCIFLLGESLTRRAFPQHIQFWTLWKPSIANQSTTFRMLCIGFFIVGYQLLYVVSFYFVSGRYLDWWMPSSQFIDPNILATYFPWFGPFVGALSAGFIEEFLFRAIPLSAAIIIGQHLKQPKRWLVIGFFVQTLIFGAGHANYPALPYYARVVELIIPSILFGVLFIRFGLLSAIVSHFIFDFVLMAMPLYLNPSSQSVSTLVCLGLLCLSPAWFSIYHWLRTGLLQRLPKDAKNKDWQSIRQDSSKQPPIKQSSLPITQPLFIGMVFLIMISLGVWFFFTPFTTHSPSQTVSRSGAQSIAKSFLEKLDPSYETQFKSPTEIYTTHRTIGRSVQEFVWEKGGNTLFKSLTNTFIYPSYWVVRFANHSGSLVEKANSHLISIDTSGKIFARHHRQHESVPGAQLTESEAQALINTAFGSDELTLGDYHLSDFEQIEASSKKQPDRTDWFFIFRQKASELSSKKMANFTTKIASDKLSDNKGETRLAVTLSGDKITSVKPYIFIPEIWQRNQRESQLMTKTFSGLQKTSQLALLIIIGFSCLFHLIKKGFDRRKLTSLFLVFGSIQLLTIFLKWPSMLYYLSTSKPIVFQLFQFLAFPILGKLFTAFIITVITYWVLTSKRPTIPFNQALSMGLVFGGVLISSSTLIFLLSPSSIPLLPNMTFTNYLLPALLPVLSFSITFFLQTGVCVALISYFLTITHQFTIRRWLIIPGLMILALFFYDLNLDYSILTWALITCRFMVVFGLGFVVVIRYGVNCIPLIIGFSYCTDLIQQCTFGAYPGGFYGFYLAGIGILGLSIWYCRALSK